MIATTRDGKRQAVSVDGGPPVTTIHHRHAGFALQGQDYSVRAVGVAAPSYELRRAEDVIAFLKSHWPRDRYTLTTDTGIYTLQREGFAAKRYGLFDGKERVGEVKSAGRWFRPDLVADLPKDLPLEVQVYLLWFALMQFSDSSVSSTVT